MDFKVLNKSGPVSFRALKLFLEVAQLSGEFKLRDAARKPEIHELCVADLVQVCDIQDSSVGNELDKNYGLTDRGEMYCKLLLRTPLPVRKKLWVDGNGNVVE